MNDTLAVSMERIDPLLVESDNAFDQATLALHLARYEFAARFAPGRGIVDCACGTGYGSQLLADRGADWVCGVDICPDAVQFARANHVHERAEYVVSDAMSFQPWKAPSMWVSLETVEHLDHPAAYLRRVHGLLSPGGLLVASVPTTVSTDGNPFHKSDFTAKSWRAMLRGAGFEIQDELPQTQPFRLEEAVGKSRGTRQRSHRSLLAFYCRHPNVAIARALQTVTKGFVNEYLSVCARRH